MAASSKTSDEKKPIQLYSVGIDLGTTYSCVGVFRDGKVEIISNEQGNRTTPSYVAFTEENRLVGDQAKEQAVLNAENTVYGNVLCIFFLPQCSLRFCKCLNGVFLLARLKTFDWENLRRPSGAKRQEVVAVRSVQRPGEAQDPCTIQGNPINLHKSIPACWFDA